MPGIVEGMAVGWAALPMSMPGIVEGMEVGAGAAAPPHAESRKANTISSDGKKMRFICYGFLFENLRMPAGWRLTRRASRKWIRNAIG
jgi:hypothetical protein